MKQVKQEKDSLDGLLSEKDFAIRSILEAEKEQPVIVEEQEEGMTTEDEEQPEQKAADDKAEITQKSHVQTRLRNADDSCWLEEVMMWSEILGEPLSKKRRRKRMEQRYGNQGYAYRG